MGGAMTGMVLGLVLMVPVAILCLPFVILGVQWIELFTAMTLWRNLTGIGGIVGMIAGAGICAYGAFCDQALLHIITKD